MSDSLERSKTEIEEAADAASHFGPAEKPSVDVKEKYIEVVSSDDERSASESEVTVSGSMQFSLNKTDELPASLLSDQHLWPCDPPSLHASGNESDVEDNTEVTSESGMGETVSSPSLPGSPTNAAVAVPVSSSNAAVDHNQPLVQGSEVESDLPCNAEGNELLVTEEEETPVLASECVKLSLNNAVVVEGDSGSETDVEDNDEITSESGIGETLSASSFPATPSRVPGDIVLPETVTKLETEQGSSVFLVGTAHFSRQSQEDVATTIRAVRPDIVVVELCKARTAILQLDEETILNESKNLNFTKIRSILQQEDKVQAILYLLLLSVSAHITKQLGMAPGGEFRTAFAEANKLAPHCTIVLGDRPINITLSRALALLSLWHKIKLTWHILTSTEPISKEEVEKCKQRDFIEEMLSEMTGQFPAISKVFVKERDVFLTRSLQSAAERVPSPLSSKGCLPRVVVGVVGIGHIPGIVERWGKVTDEDIIPIMKVPPPTLSSRILKMTFKVSFYGLIGYGIYKCLPKSIKQSFSSFKLF